MAKADIAAVLALVAALFIAISDAVQQRLAHDVTDERVGAIALFTRLLRNPRWWLGSLIAAVGFALQAAALGLGSVVLVQALFVTSLLFALPISAKLGHRKVTPSEWTWAVLLAASVAVFVTVGDPQAGHSRAPLGTWMVVVAVMGPALVLCLLGARIWSGPVRAVLLGLVSGSLWGLFSVLTKGVVDRLGDGIWAVLRTPELYAWVLVAIAATVWQAVVVPGRHTDRLAADVDGGRAGRRLGARHRGARREASDQRRRPVRARAGGGRDGRGHGGTGPRCGRGDRKTEGSPGHPNSPRGVLGALAGRRAERDTTRSYPPPEDHSPGATARAGPGDGTGRRCRRRCGCGVD